MIHRDAGLSQAVEQAVSDIEQRTDAELVVVIAARAAAYTDLSLWAGILAAAATAVALEMQPWPVGMAAFLLEVTAMGLLAGWIASRPVVLGRILPSSRAAAEAQRAARAAFVDEAVHGTPGRIGVLVHVSVLERRVDVVPDLGVEGRVPHGALDPVVSDLRADTVAELVEGLQALGDVLARHVPHHEGSDAVDLPNAPRIRP